MIKFKKCQIVAEGCDNHFGKLSNAKKMVDLAKKANCDMIKFQHHLPDEEMLRKVPKSKNFDISLYDFLKKYALKIDDHKKLLKYCNEKKIKYLCTPFSFKAAEELNDIGVKWFKMGSGEFLDTPFIEKIIKFNKPLILSTGMSTIKEINFIYNFLVKKRFFKFTFMNCTSEYPPVLKDINLGFIKKMIVKYPKATIGHSDHTNNIYTSIGAVANGAKIIEKHVYLDGLNNGPDKDVSISFKQMANLVEAIRDVEAASGSLKKINPKEKIIRKWAHRSIVSIKDIKKGEKLSYNNIWSKRPGIGIPSHKMKNVIGRFAKKDIKKDSLINKKDFS